MRSRRPLLDETTAAFIQSGVSILAASSDEGNRPAVVRALGCRVSADRDRVTVLVPAADPFLDAVRRTSRIAVVFCLASTHRTIQLKGKDAETTPLEKDDDVLRERYAEAFLADVCKLGYSRELMYAVLSYRPSDLAAIAFSPTARFLQTPGPRAGDPLDS